MNRKSAREIAEKITNDQIKQMFDSAKSAISDWTVRATVNLGMTKGAAWNILAKDFDVTKSYHILAKTNMVREFGDYLPIELKPTKKTKKDLPKPIHQNPIF